MNYADLDTLVAGIATHNTGKEFHIVCGWKAAWQMMGSPKKAVLRRRRKAAPVLTFVADMPR